MKKNTGVLKGFGFVMIIFGVIYAILGTLALAGVLGGILPGHESQEVLVLILAYAIALLALICGISCVKGSAQTARIFGGIIAVIGLVSLIYLQIAQDTFNLFDCIALLLGISIFYQAGKTE